MDPRDQSPSALLTWAGSLGVPPPAVRRLATAAVAPVYAAPNAGLPRIEAGRAVYSLTPDAFAQAGVRLREAGARLLAGCCGTTPEHIRALRGSVGS